MTSQTDAVHDGPLRLSHVGRMPNSICPNTCHFVNGWLDEDHVSQKDSIDLFNESSHASDNGEQHFISNGIALHSLSFSNKNDQTFISNGIREYQMEQNGGTNVKVDEKHNAKLSRTDSGIDRTTPNGFHVDGSHRDSVDYPHELRVITRHRRPQSLTDSDYSVIKVSSSPFFQRRNLTHPIPGQEYSIRFKPSGETEN